MNRGPCTLASRLYVLCMYLITFTDVPMREARMARRCSRLARPSTYSLAGSHEDKLYFAPLVAQDEHNVGYVGSLGSH